MKKTYGVIKIHFNQNVSEDKVQQIISRVYADNSQEIDGMTYLELKDKETYLDVSKAIHSTTQEKKNPQRKLCEVFG